MKIENPGPMLTTSAGAPSSPATSRDEFLSLLVAQLEHQNPLEPQSGADFIAQLAQFSAVEQAAETNHRLERIQAGQAATNSASLAGFIGNRVTAAASSFDVTDDGGTLPEIQVEYAGQPARISVMVENSTGQVVRTMDIAPTSSGRATVAWDSNGESGPPLPAGRYHLRVEATTKDGTPVDAAASLRGFIDAVSFDRGVPMLRVGRAQIAAETVMKIE